MAYLHPDGKRMNCQRCAGTFRVVVNQWGDTFSADRFILDCPDCHGTGLEPLDLEKAKKNNMVGYCYWAGHGEKNGAAR